MGVGPSLARRRSDLSLFVTCPDCDAHFEANAELAGFEMAEDLRRAAEAQIGRLGHDVAARLALHLLEAHRWRPY